jgi:hypothetical protein
MRAAAGLAYFALVFAAGTILGIARVLLVAPHLGAAGAVLVELPLMLGLSWVACRTVVRRLAVPGRRPARLAMGATAFALLMVAELVLDMLVNGASLASHFAALWAPAMLPGLAGQVVFALMPLAVRNPA